MSLIPSPRRERQVFQMATAILALIPIGAGLVGVLAGFGVFGDGAAVARDLDSHGRYLSGLLLGIGLGFWSTVPRPEACGPRVRLLATIVVIGGLARLERIHARCWMLPFAVMEYTKPGMAGPQDLWEIVADNFTFVADGGIVVND